MNIQKMLKQAQQMQAKMQSAQADLAEKTVEATAGGGKVTVTANGGGDILSVKINPTGVDAEDVEMLEDLILSGVRKAQEKAKSLMQTEMEKVTGGMPGLPGMGM
jgi:DNA-binding YbaB/EbfC family protein